MAKVQVFCGAETCSDKCPAHDSNDFSFIFCKIIKAKLEAEESKQKAYEKMKEYWCLKIEGEKICNEAEKLI